MVTESSKRQSIARAPTTQDILRVWRGDRCIGADSATGYLQWIGRFRRYCRELGLEEADQLTREGADQFHAWYVRRSVFKGGASGGISSSLRSLRRVYEVMGLPVQPWQRPQQKRMPATALLRDYAIHLGQHRGNPEITIQKKLDHAGRLLAHLSGAGKSWRQMRLPDIDTFLIQCADRYARATTADIASSASEPAWHRGIPEGHTATSRTGKSALRAPREQQLATTAMSRRPSRSLFGHLESYFTAYLPRQRGASPHTIRAYRDALTLLLKFVAEQRHCGVSSLQMSDLDADTVMRFLDHVESARGNCAATRNCRRAAIRGFFKHLLRDDLAHSQQYMRVLAIPAKKARLRPATYLEPEDAQLIISMPDQRTQDGWRDYTLLLFLYNVGARVSEAAGLHWEDLHLIAPRSVRLRGKGKKERLLPLWTETANALHRLRGMSQSANQQCVFVNRHGQPLTRDGIAYLLTKHAAAAANCNGALKRKHITPHVLRHSCAVALLQSGTDVTVIRDYLGHSSVATTGRYITINLQMKRDAMDAFWEKARIEPSNAKPWKPKSDLLAFLKSL